MNEISSVINNSSYAHLPGVHQVECSSIENIEIKKTGNWGDYPITLNGLFKRFNLIDIGKLEVKRTTEGVRYFYEYKLTFETKESFLSESFFKNVFRITLVSGKVYLIGIPERPYPDISITYKASDSITNKKVSIFTISWKTANKPILVKV